MKIQKISDENLNLIPEKMNVELIGDIQLSYLKGKFNYSIINRTEDRAFSFPTSKPTSLSEFTDNRYGFVLTENEQYVGHTVVEHKFNNTLYIEDFDICPNYRGQKYSQLLMEFLVNHAKECNLKGISLEVQSNNVIAFLFYLKTKFVIGGFDTMFYEKTVQKGQSAIFLYKDI